MSVVSAPSTSYPTQNGISRYAPSTSSFVTASSVNALRRCAWRAATASNHPTRRGRPVVAPYSFARSRRASPSPPAISVGNGPSPTAVEYAFTTPITFVMYRDGLRVERRVAVPPQDLLLSLELVRDPFAEATLVAHLVDLDPVTRHLVRVGWADALTGRAELLPAALALVESVDRDVPRHQEMRA